MSVLCHPQQRTNNHSLLALFCTVRYCNTFSCLSWKMVMIYFTGLFFTHRQSELWNVHHWQLLVLHVQRTKKRHKYITWYCIRQITWIRLGVQPTPLINCAIPVHLYSCACVKYTITKNSPNIGQVVIPCACCKAGFIRVQESPRIEGPTSVRWVNG